MHNNGITLECLSFDKLVTWTRVSFQVSSGVDSVSLHGQVGEVVSPRCTLCSEGLPRLRRLLETGRGVPLTSQHGRYILLQRAVGRMRTGTAKE